MTEKKNLMNAVDWIIRHAFLDLDVRLCSYGIHGASQKRAVKYIGWTLIVDPLPNHASQED